jgi:accessory colonization factor AcfC
MIMLRKFFIGIVFIGIVFSGTKLYLDWDTNRLERNQAQKNLPTSFQSLLVSLENQIDAIDKLLMATNEKDKDQAMLLILTKSSEALIQSLEINRSSLIAYQVAPYAINQVINDLNNELTIAMNDVVQTGNRSKVEAYQWHLRMAAGELATYKLTSKKAVSALSGADIINYGIWRIELEILSKQNTYLNRVTVARQDEIDDLIRLVTSMEWKTGVVDIRTPDFRMFIASKQHDNAVGYEGWIDESGVITLRDHNNENQYGVIDAATAKEAKLIFEKYGWKK